jgi:hypothetical protein
MVWSLKIATAIINSYTHHYKSKKIICVERRFILHAETTLVFFEMRTYFTASRE